MSSNIKVEISGMLHLISMARNFYPVPYWEAVNSINQVAWVVNTASIVVGTIA